MFKGGLIHSASEGNGEDKVEGRGGRKIKRGGEKAEKRDYKLGLGSSVNCNRVVRVSG